jgi:hypothetical protein
VGYYDGGSYDAATSRWLDKSGSGNHASTQGTILKAAAALNGKDYIYGGTTSQVRWPQVSQLPLPDCTQCGLAGAAWCNASSHTVQEVYPSGYTLFHYCKWVEWGRA